MAVVNCKVCNIRPNYNNLKMWMDNKNNVYIGRKGIVFIDKERFPKKSSIFCNPYKITKDTTRDEVLQKYRVYMEKMLDEDINMQHELSKLKNKNLGCWCAPEKCHGDVLLELINKYS
jgi:hypothetical protein